MVVSAKDGVQAQTRILFYALQKMKIPIVIFVNKIDQYGIYTNGQSVCFTELKGYQIAAIEPVSQPRRPNSRINKVRHMFSKIFP